MKRLAIFFSLILVSGVVYGGKIFDLTNDTTYVKTPTTGFEPTTKTYVDNAITNNIMTTNGLASIIYLTNYTDTAGYTNRTITNGLASTIYVANAVTNVPGALTNAVIKYITTYSITNPIIILAENTNVWNWLPPTNVTLSPSFSGPGVGYAGSGMLRLVRTNNDNTIIWPTNIMWFSNGTRTTNAPSLLNYNRIVVDYFNETWTLGVVSTNTTE